MTPTSTDLARSATSVLFAPGDRPERFAKAEAAGAGSVVIDLEDAVAHDNEVAEVSGSGVIALTEKVRGTLAAPQITADAPSARRLGFAGKLCVHRRQLTPTIVAFAPTDAELERARKGVDAVDGQMVDKPVLDRAEQILKRVR